MTNPDYKVLLGIHKKLLEAEAAGLFEVSMEEWQVLEEFGGFTYGHNGYESTYIDDMLAEERQFLAARLP